MPTLSHLTSSTFTKSNVHFAHSMGAVFIEPDLQRLLAFQVPYLYSNLHCFGCSKEVVQAQDPV
jgi:hypothetical protein